MPLFSFGGPQYDVDDVKLAFANQDGTFGSLVDLPSCDLYANMFNIKSAKARGDGTTTAVASSFEDVTVTMRSVSFSQAAFATILGFSSYDYASTPLRQKKMSFVSARALPYFAVVGRALAGEVVGGCTMLAVYWCKIMDSFEIRFEYNAFTTPEIRATALPHPTLFDIATGYPLLGEIVEYETRRDIAIPLPLSL